MGLRTDVDPKIREQKVVYGELMTEDRLLRPGAFDVHDASLVVCDESLPLLAEVDATTGSLRRFFSWQLSTEHRDREIANDVAIADDKIFVSSPAAGGLVQINRLDGAVTVTPLEADPGTLVLDRGIVWIIASPDGDDEQREAGASDPNRRRPVVWEDATEQELEAFNTIDSVGWGLAIADVRWGLAVASPSLVDEEEEHLPATAAAWREEEGDDEEGWLPQPLWRCTGSVAERVPLDAEQIDMVSTEEGIVFVCRLPTDPIVKHVEPGGGGVAYRYPSSVLAGESPERLHLVASLPSDQGVLSVDSGRVWLLGFGEYGSGPETLEGHAREVDVARRTVRDPLEIRLTNPVTAVAGRVLDRLERDYREPAGKAGRSVIRLLPLTGGPPRELAVPRLPSDVTAKADGDTVWFSALDDGSMVYVEVATAKVGRLRTDFDCTELVPEPAPPPGVDTAALEQRMFDEIRSELSGGWVDEAGNESPLIHGSTFDCIEMRGHFPDAAVVALFHHQDRPEIQFGRKWALWDELGNPIEREYGVGIYLMEDVESSDGIAKFDTHKPDEGGVVWI